MIPKAACVGLLALAVVVASAPRATAAIDMSGPWGVLATDNLFLFPFYCTIDVVQTGSAATVTGTCPIVGTLSLAGTIDTGTGAFSLSGTSSTLCTTSLTVNGTANPASTAFDAGFVCNGLPGTLEGRRCGNGVLDPGEGCDDGGRSEGDCCSATCSLDPAGTTCAGDVSSCTLDVCDGSGTCTHPSVPAETPCTTDFNVCTDDACDGAGNCDHVPNAAPCSDGNECTLGDVCTGGTCMPSGCSLCCDAGAGCVPAPATGCKEPTAPTGPLAYRGGPGDPRAKLQWKWRKGAATALVDFGDPLTSTDYAMCLYRRADAGPDVGLVLAATAPAGGTCRGRSCWTAQVGKGFKYKDRERTPDGLDQVVLRTGPTGEASVTVKGKGASLRFSDIHGPLPVIAQLRASNGQCWEGRYPRASRDLVFFVGDQVTQVDFLAKRSSPSGAFLD